MSKVKREGTTHYELLYIVSNKYTEDEVSPINENVKKIITDNGGKTTYSENWGKKKLAYPIQHFNHGYYSLYEFDLDGENLAKIENLLKLSNEILRHQIVKKKIKTTAEIEKNKKIAEKIAAKNIEKKEKDEEKKDEEKKEEEKDKKDKDKVDLKDLDEKLDKILETDDLL